MSFVGSADNSRMRNSAEASKDLHLRDDLDQGPRAHHHTLGEGPYQAAPGDHSHPQPQVRFIGEVMTWWGTLAQKPANWLAMDGSAIPAQYPDLITHIGGPNLPNLRDRMVVGAGSTYALAATGGSDNHTLNEFMLPPHQHAVGTLSVTPGGSHSHGAGSYGTDNPGGHVHPVPRKANVGSSTGYARGNATSEPNDDTNTAGGHTHTVTGTSGTEPSHTHALLGQTANGPGLTAPVDHRNKYYAMFYLIYAGEPV